MRKTTLLLAALLMAAAAAAGCQGTANVNTNTAADPHAGHGNMNHNTAPAAGHDMSHMDHDMSKMASAPGAADQPYDLQFIDSMIHHHEGAVTMSKTALEKTENPELKPFLQKIIDDQAKEIAQMKEWRDKWYAGKPSALNMEMPGMKMGSEKMGTGSHDKEMQAMNGKDFDLHFIDMMIPHHEGAIAMARDAQQKAEHEEIKKLTNEIIREQQAEIDKMRDWKTKWSK